MAWRIDEAVVRGEIDNREHGRVKGRIWFLGREEPVELDLAGDCWRDMAGRRIEFTNPSPKPFDLTRFPARQTGVIGDCTASRKVKVPDIPMDQIGEYYAAKKKWTWHWGNSLYLEWFSTTNGRVVIESASYQITVDPNIAWELTVEEEEQQRRANAEAMGNFMERLGRAVIDSKDGKVEEDPAMPSSLAADSSETPVPEKLEAEVEAEKIEEENERLLDRIAARMEREGEGADFETIMQEELERRRVERGEPPLTPEEELERDQEIEEMNRDAAEAADLDEEPRESHPLAVQAYNLAMRLINEPEQFRWLPADASEEHPLVDFGGAASRASMKFSAALNGIDWPPPVEICANAIVRLKRARSYVDDALMAAEVCLQQNLGTSGWIAGAQRDLNRLARECDIEIGKLRARLANDH